MIKKKKLRIFPVCSIKLNKRIAQIAQIRFQWLKRKTAAAATLSHVSLLSCLQHID
jgi:hypothetical protein